MIKEQCTKEDSIAALESLERPGMDKMLEWLEKEGYYTSSASTRFHGCYRGGLMQHSWNLMRLVLEKNEEYGLGIEEDSIVLATLLHDICKVGAYNKSSTAKSGYSWNKLQPKGHALLSLLRIAKCGISLLPIEEDMIRYHMGIYGLEEFDPGSGKGEYPLRGGGLVKAWVQPIVKTVYFCDEFASMSEKFKERS